RRSSDLGQVAVSAGGAGGIGYVTAQRLASQGARIVLLVRSNLAAAESRAAELPGQGHGAVLASIDDSASLQSAAQNVSTRWGRADILVNTAGMTKPVAHRDLDARADALVDPSFVAN